MAQFTVRNIEDDVKESLKQRARRNGTSLEAEVRSILRAAALGDSGAASPGLGSRIAARFSKVGLRAPLPELKGQKARPPDFTP